MKLQALHLTLKEVVDALANTNELISSGMHEENRQLYLTVLDNRVRQPKDLGEVVLAWRDGSPVYLREVADVRLGEAPQVNVGTADGRLAVLMDI